MKKESFLYATAFVMDSSFALMGLCVPLLAVRLGATYNDLGAISATGASIYALSCLVSGRLSDRVGYRRSLTAASFAIALLFFFYTAVTGIGQLTLLSGAIGLVLSGFWSPLQAWLGQGKHRRSLLRTLGKFNVSWSSGLLVGPALGGILYETDPNWAFILCAGLVGLVFLALLLLKIQEPVPAETAPSEPASYPASRQFLPIGWAANFATFFATGTVRSLFPKLATDLGILPGPLGRLLALIGLGKLTTFFFISRTDRWQFRLWPLVGVQLLTIVGLSTLVFGTSSGLFALGLLTHGILAGTTFTASIFYSLHTEGPGGRRTGIHEAIVGSGFLLGPLAGGFVAEHVSPRAPYLLSALVILCAIAFQTYLLKKRSAREWVPQAGD